MFIDLTPDQRALRDQLRGYFAGRRPPSAPRCSPSGTATSTATWCAGWAGTGWLGVGWPARYGGRGFGQVEQ